MTFYSLPSHKHRARFRFFGALGSVECISAVLAVPDLEVSCMGCCGEKADARHPNLPSYITEPSFVPSRPGPNPDDDTATLLPAKDPSLMAERHGKLLRTAVRGAHEKTWDPTDPRPFSKGPIRPSPFLRLYKGCFAGRCGCENHFPCCQPIQAGPTHAIVLRHRT